MKTIALFYKSLVEPGGAERLLIEEYKEFKRLGYQVTVVSQKISNSSFFSDIEQSDRLVLGSNFFLAWFRGSRFFQSKADLIISASGHIETFFYTLFTQKRYSLKIHHPSFMSFNEYDKYSIFQRKHFDMMTSMNYGASRFVKIKKNLSYKDHIYINVRALFSILAVKRAENIFVLSEYAKREKKILFNVDSFVVRGALNRSSIGIKHNPIDAFQVDGPVIFTLARLDRNKRIDILIRAFSIFLLRHPSAVLFIGGQGEELDNLKNISIDLGIESNIKFLGFIDEKDLSDYYSSADIFVSIDWADYRITTYEALSCHTRVINSNETDKDDFLEQNGFLRLIQPSQELVAEAMSEIIDDEAVLDFKALDDYLKNFTWESYAREIIARTSQKKPAFLNTKT